MTYFDSVKVKNDLGLTDTSQDVNIQNWGSKADAMVDDLLYEVATKNAKQSQLPSLPLVTPTQSIKDASSDFTKAEYFAYIRDWEAHKTYKEKATDAIKQFVIRLRTDAEIYGSVIGDKIVRTNTFVSYIPST